jgi:hypothetical protein
VVEHKFEAGHDIEFGSTSILDKALSCMDRVIKEAIEISLYPQKLRQGQGVQSQSVTNMVNYRDEPIRRQDQNRQT